MSECLGNVSAADAQILSASFENNDRSACIAGIQWVNG